MNAFERGLQVYLLGLALIAALGVVWGTNEFVLNNTAASTGWPLMVAIAGVLVLAGVMIRHLQGTTSDDSTVEQYPWSGRE